MRTTPDSGGCSFRLAGSGQRVAKMEAQRRNPGMDPRHASDSTALHLGNALRPSYDRSLGEAGSCFSNVFVCTIMLSTVKPYFFEHEFAACGVVFLAFNGRFAAIHLRG